MKIWRALTSEIKEKLHQSDKIIILYGPRQVGKTTLCKDIMRESGLHTLYINANEAQYSEALSSRDAKKLTDLTVGYELLIIDEAQRVRDIGINLKILSDAHTGVKIIATGSSSFELANKISEPLTGRHWTYFLYPIAELERKHHWNDFELASTLEDRLVWGSYPETFSLAGEERMSYLRTLASDYLYKDILALQDVRHANKIRDLLKLLAFQIGNQVSLSELASSLEMSKETVARYIDLLEKTFVLFRLAGFSRNLRKEITKTQKYYFYDVGLRNSVIDNFKSLTDRADTGVLWKNFLFMERVKRNAYHKAHVSPYFWRTYTGAEIDYVEEEEGSLRGYEFKWGDRPKRPSAPRAWVSAYPDAAYNVINRENYLDFIAAA
mgnify:FL=1